MKIYDVRGIGASLTGSFSGSFKGLFTGPLDGVAATSSYVEYSNVANKPALVSGSSQVLAFNIFATTGSNQFNGNQAITGSLTVTGQVIAQTLNVQQVTSSIVFSSGSNRFGNNSGNTHSFTGSVGVTGSLTVAGAGTFTSSVTAGNNYLVNNLSATKKGYTYQSPASNWGPQVSGLYFTPNNSVDAKTTFTLELWNGVGSIITPLTITDTGAATFSSNITAGGNLTLSSSYPRIYLIDTNNNSDFSIINADGNFSIYDDTNSVERLYITSGGNVGIGTNNPGNLLALEKSSNSGSGSTFPRIKIINTLATQGDGTSTFNFADIMISAGNEAVNMFLATTYAAGTWAPAGIINVSTNHDLQFKTNNTTRLTLANSGAATFSSTVTATRLTANADNSGLIVDVAGRHGFMKYVNYATGLVGANTGTDSGISTWLGRFSGTITSPTQVFQDLIVSTSGNVSIGSVSLSSHKLLLQGNLSMSGSGLVRTYYAESTTLGAQFDIFRFLTESGTVFANGAISGILFLNASDTATGANQISYTFHLQTNGNGTLQANITQMSFQLRGTQPIQSIGLENDGVSGAVKVVGSVVGSGVSGCRVYATFIGVAV